MEAATWDGRYALSHCEARLLVLLDLDRLLLADVAIMVNLRNAF
jgi:hypothetical protein